jgi:hypothetical protein
LAFEPIGQTFDQIFETWNTRFDIERLRKHLEEHVLPLEIVSQSSSFGGWSVTSRSGSYQDGWYQGHLVLEQQNLSPDEKSRILVENGIYRGGQYLPTEICHGYLAEVLKTIEDQGLKPERVRIIRLRAEGRSSWHRDAPDEHYAVRLHIPIVTNSGCFFEVSPAGVPPYEGEDHERQVKRAHLPADGSAYFLWVNRVHRVVNLGSEHRYHIVMNIRDEGGFTKHHKFPL